MHKNIIDVAKNVYGIDILSEEIDILKNKGYLNLYNINILNDPIPNNLKKINFDKIILGEILEHINNPSHFLNLVKQNFKFKEIIITVPNAFYIGNFFNNFKNKELVNSDHRYWFTPYTISKQVYLANLVVKNIYFSNYRLNRYNLIMRLIKSKFPFFNTTIVVIVSK